MDCYKIKTKDNDISHIVIHGYGTNEIGINRYLQYLHKYTTLKNDTIGLKARMLCDFSSYLESLETDLVETDIQIISDFLVYLRCPDGIKLDTVNKAAVSENTIKKYISTIIDFYNHLDFRGYFINEESITKIKDCFVYEDKKTSHYNPVYHKKTLNTIIKELNDLNPALLVRIEL